MKKNEYENLREEEKFLLDKSGIPYKDVTITHEGIQIESDRELDYETTEIIEEFTGLIFQRIHENRDKRRKNKQLSKEDLENLQYVVDCYKDSIFLDEDINEFIKENENITPNEVYNKFPISIREANSIKDLNYENTIKVPITLTMTKDLIINLDNITSFEEIADNMENDLNGENGFLIKIKRKLKRSASGLEASKPNSIFLDEVASLTSDY